MATSSRRNRLIIAESPRTVCETPWCCAYAVPGRRTCSVHLHWPQYESLGRLIWKQQQRIWTPEARRIASKGGGQEYWKRTRVEEVDDMADFAKLSQQMRERQAQPEASSTAPQGGKITNTPRPHNTGSALNDALIGQLEALASQESKLSVWEQDFLQSILGQVRSGRTVSAKQQVVIDRITDKIDTGGDYKRKRWDR